MESNLTTHQRLEIARHYSEILKIIGRNPEKDENVAETPMRYAKMLGELCYREPFNLTEFWDNDENTDESHILGSTALESGMIVQGPIPFASLCEHHVLPFTGHAWFGYIPSSTEKGLRIVGLSKLARIVGYEAKGLNTQERITRQVAMHLLKSPVDPVGVGVVIKAEHTCMSIRGPKVSGAKTSTQFLTGPFSTNSMTRGEFLSIVDSLKP